MEHVTLFYETDGLGSSYLCDRCDTSKLRYDEWDKNRNLKGVYCDECWCWIHLQHYTNSDGHSITIRSERKITP